MPNYPQQKPNTIPYDSPSGSINIGKWIPPFKEVTGGFGFVGVVAEDTESGKLQCHECGKWFEQLPSHYSAAHGLNGDEYRERFGLLQSTALKCMRIRKSQSTLAQKMHKDGTLNHGNVNGYGFSKGNSYAGNRKGKPKAVEHQNKFGVCELQVAEAIRNLAKKLGRTPALTEVIEEYGQGLATLIHHRYAGYLNLLKNLELTPNYSSFNPKYSREVLIAKGVELLEKHGRLNAKEMLTEYEQKAIYKYVGSWKDWYAESEKASKEKTLPN